MTDSYRALCSDFYLNQKLSLKLDLPKDRQTVLDLFDRVRRQFPEMGQFRRYRDELALETATGERQSQWMAIRSNNIRSGNVNPDSFSEAYKLHGHILEVAPYFLSISPLDIDYLELLYGFDLTASGNHDQIVFDALIDGSPMSDVFDTEGGDVVDCQPIMGMKVHDDEVDIEVHFEIKTRTSPDASRGHEGANEPISVYMMLRKYGPEQDVRQLGDALSILARHGERLIESRVVPNLLVPIRNMITMGRP